MTVEFVERWIRESPYTAFLGAEPVEIGPERVRLRLPYRDANSNPGQALHGGVAASLGAVGGQAVARAALGEASGPWHGCGLQVSYLAAAIGEEVRAEARLLRRGKELCFAEVDVETEAGKPIAHVSTIVRARFGAEPAPGAACAGDDGAADPGPMGPHIGGVPFIGSRGIVVEHMKGGRSRLRMPFAADRNGDRDGSVHEGALLALLDTAGAMAAWAETGPGRYKASTPALQARILAAPADDLVAYGRVEQRDGDLFWCRVEAAGVRDGRICADATVFYRIVT